MRTNKGLFQIWLAVIVLASGTAFAMEGMARQAAFPGEQADLACHALMTEKECADFLATLAVLPKGAARNAFMARHSALMRERESLCDPIHYRTAAEVIYPVARQALRQF